MTMLREGTRIQLKNILYLTDFSEPSRAAAALRRSPGPHLWRECPRAACADARNPVDLSGGGSSR